MTKLRVYHIQNIPNRATYHDVATPTCGWRKIVELTQADLREDSGVTSNVMGLEEFLDGEWVEWYDDEGYDIDEWADKRGLIA